jgi:hypothetical protein
MKLNPKQFIDLDAEFSEFKITSVDMLPIPYERVKKWVIGNACEPNLRLRVDLKVETVFLGSRIGR